MDGSSETQTTMKLLPALVLSAFLSIPAASLDASDYPARFRGVCQQTGRDLWAYWRPVECTDGRVVMRWVNECPERCRPAYLGKKRRDFFNSHLMNPANPRRNAPRNCLRNAGLAETSTSGRNGRRPRNCCR